MRVGTSVSARPAFGQRVKTAPMNIAHRFEFYNKVENTVEAKQAGLAVADAAELDVQMTKDGHPVVYHDDVLGGAGFYDPAETRQRPISDYTLAELRSKVVFDQRRLEDALSKKAGEPVTLNLSQKPTIPTLNDLLPIPQGKRLFIEIKRPDQLGVYSDGLEEAVVKWVNANKLRKQTTVISFNPMSLERVKKLDPNMSVGLDVFGSIAANPVMMHALNSWLKLDYWLPPFAQTTPKLINQAHKLGMKIAPWVWPETKAQEVARMQELLGTKVDGIITNQPGALAHLIKARFDQKKA